MDVTALDIAGALVLTPRQFADDRGVFLEWYRADVLSEVLGHPFVVAQANASVSSRGTLRGIHYADVPPSQAKFVTCVAGAVLDVVVDLRVGSATFGQWRAVRLDAADRRALYVPEGLGHAFLSLEDGSTVVYLCNESYNPGHEHAVHPLDPELGIEWPLDEVGGQALLSPKDLEAPTLAEALAAQRLPTLEAAASLSAARVANGGSSS
jgi:dTDP-4-dehydrorhamnose 3,5-epimerase